MSDLHKNDPDSPYADDLEFVRDYARRNDGYSLVQPVVDFINSYLSPQVIRTVEELEALDPYTMVLTDSRYTAWYSAQIEEWELPAVVIRDGAEVRAARKALEKETDND